MWRNPDTRLRPVVHQNISRQQFAAHFVGVRAFDRHGPRALRRILRGIYAPAPCVRALEDPRGHANRFFTDGFDSDFVQDCQPWLTSIKRGDMRGPIQKTERIVARIDGPGLELKWPAMGKPSGKRRPQFMPQILANIKISNNRAAAEPLEHAAYREIHIEFARVERQRAGGLKNIKNDAGADAVRFFDDSFGVDDERTAEKH